MGTEVRSQKLVMAGVMAGMVMALTLAIRIPIPATQGYFHLGDSMVFLAIMVLGYKQGALSAAMGSALADLLGGYAMYAPVSFCAKGSMAIVTGIVITRGVRRIRSKKMILLLTIGAMTLGGLVMVCCYYLAESIMYGSAVTPLVAVPVNCLQFAIGMVIALAITALLGKTPLGQTFEYNIRER